MYGEPPFGAVFPTGDSAVPVQKAHTIHGGDPSYNTVMKKELPTAEVKTLVRRARRTYAQTHELLGQVSCSGTIIDGRTHWHGFPVTKQVLAEVMINHREAEELFAFAQSLRPTRQVMRLRDVAKDNLDVAGEALDCLVLRANEGITFY